MQRWRLAFVAVLVALAAGASHAQDSAEGESSATAPAPGLQALMDSALASGRMDAALMGNVSALGEDGAVLVMVHLEEDAGLSQELRALQASGLPSEEMKDMGLEIRKRHVYEAQERVLPALSASGFTLRHKYSLVSAVAGYATRAGLGELLAQPNVRAVTSVGTATVNLPDSIPITNTTGVWSLSVGGVPVTGLGRTVCVIDTGLYYQHTAFGACSQATFLAGGCPKVPWGYDYAYDDSNPADGHGHGTHVAGIVASNGFSCPSLNCKGVAPGARIVAMKALSDSGSGSWADILAAIEGCTLNRTRFNISVITMSIGINGWDTCLAADCDDDWYWNDIPSALHNAYDQGIFIDASSGNSYSSTGVSFPACNRYVFSVGATYDSPGFASDCGGTVSADQPTCYSNRCSLLDVWAPGSWITSSYPGSANNYVAMEGTSMAAPHVAGAAALIQQYGLLKNNSILTPSQVADALIRTGKNVTLTVTKPRIDVWRAVVFTFPSSPGLTTGNVTPAGGTGSTSFNYSVTYNDANNLAPSYIQAYVDGTPHTMAAAGPPAYQAGVRYWWATTLGAGPHTYWFNASNGRAQNVTAAVQNSPLVNIRPPTLANGSVFPPGGNNGTVFNFSVYYSDYEGSAPSYVRVHLDGAPHAMAGAASNYTVGGWYRYETALSPGNHTYLFNASDGDYVNATPQVSGSPRVNYPPSLSAASVAPLVGYPTDNFNFTVLYQDLDGEAPLGISLVLDGSPKQVSWSSSDHASGVVYYWNGTVPSQGTHNFWFNATDGNYTVSTPTSSGPMVVDNAPDCVGANPVNETEWNVAVYTYCSDTSILPTSTGDGPILVSGGNTLNLSNTYVYVNNTLVVLDGRLNLEYAVLSFIR
jgi:subtilisin family serine protease